MSSELQVLAKSIIEKARDRAVEEEAAKPISANALDVTKNSGYAALAGSILAAVVAGLEGFAGDTTPGIIAAALGVVAVAFLANAWIVSSDQRARAEVTIASKSVLPRLAEIAANAPVPQLAPDEAATTPPAAITALGSGVRIKVTDEDDPYTVYAVRIEGTGDGVKTWYLAARSGVKPKWISAS